MTVQPNVEVIDNRYAFADSEVVLNALPHPLLLITKDDSIIFANTAAEAFLQSSHTILCRQKITDVIPFDSPLVSLIKQVRRGGASVNEYGIDIGNPRIGQNHLIDVYGGCLPEDPDVVMVILQQRTMAQMIERQLTHRAAARSVSGMAAILAHEIKNPLSGIRGAVQLLEGSIKPEEKPLTTLIYNEIDRICKLVDRMEIFGDERPQSYKPTNIHDVLDHVKQIAINGFAKPITFHENYDPSLPFIPGNRDKLIQVFLNLVKNAAEAIGPDRTDGSIIMTTSFRPGVRLSVPGSFARISLPLEISIEDNGPGIQHNLKPHLFEPFVTTKKSSSGLGLALVAKIIGDHGGVIECDSSSNRTVFRVLMPIHNASNNDFPENHSESQKQPA